MRRRGSVVSGTDTVQIQNKISITDAFSAVPGVYVSDYGGLAGLKSISLRGMGSSHTDVYVDGVRVGNVQSGLTDLGIEYNPLRGGFWHMKMKADGFFNILSDKIISAPSDLDPNVWLPYNVGRARMAGFDLQASLNYCRSELKSSITARYGYQSAIDRTPGSSSFGKQIELLKDLALCLKVMARNITGCRYELAGGYPMSGRSLYGGIDIRF